jgi:hypothetical protein
MSNDTAIIRVARRTRDLLVEEARERGVSVALLLAEIAREREAEAIWRSPRPGPDGRSRDINVEDHAWDAVLELD